MTPTSKAPLSHWRSLPSFMSLARCSRPLNRLAPWVCTTRSRASGLLLRKLLGAPAATSCSTRKLMR
ncbi:hypothetical protein D3C85_1404260 [compost metagenome]